MAISLGAGKKVAEKQAAARRAAESYRREQKKSKNRGFFSNILGGLGGKLLGGAITGFLGLTGIGAPLGLALGNMLAKKGAFELTRGMGAKSRNIRADSKYGYGEAEVKTLREGLEQQQEAMEGMDFGKELVSSYMSAGAKGELKGAFKDIGKGGLAKQFGVGKDSMLGKGLGARFKGAGEGFTAAWEDMTTWGAKEDIKGEPKLVRSPLHPEQVDKVAEEVLEAPEYIGFPFEHGQGIDMPGPWAVEGESIFDLTQEVDEGFKYPFGETRLGAVTKEEEDWAKGFMQPEKKFQEGGQVQEYRGGGTISDYFGMQGKSLGGSNKQSLAEILGRK